jgi:hypothetical protein
MTVLVDPFRLNHADLRGRVIRGLFLVALVLLAAAAAA